MKNRNIIKDYISHKRVCQERSWRCDFYITFQDGEKMWVEYDGLKQYRPQKERFIEKINYYKNNNYNLKIFTSRKSFIYFILEKTNNIEEYPEWSSKRSKIMKVQGKLMDNYIKLLLEDVMGVCKKIGHVPTSTEYNKHGSFSITTLYDNIGKWQHILELAGLWEKYEKKRLTIKQVKKIKKLLSEGNPCKDIANEMNVSLAQVKHIYYGDRWTSVK